MNKVCLLIVAFCLSINCLAKVNIDNEILELIVNENIAHSKFYIGCEKSKTIFNYKDINEQTGLKVPSKILSELHNSSKKSQKGSWKLNFPFKKKRTLEYLISSDCQNNNSLSEEKRIPVFFISQPIYDRKLENCIVSFSSIQFKGSGYGCTYLLKKVYGSWTVIAIFDNWIS